MGKTKQRSTNQCEKMPGISRHRHAPPCVAEHVLSLLCALLLVAELLSFSTLHTGKGGSGAEFLIKFLKKEDYSF